MRSRLMMMLVLVILFAREQGLGAQMNDDSWEFRLIFDQMLTIRFGGEYHVSGEWSARGSFGFAPLNPATMTGDLCVLYHLRDPSRKFQADVYAGMPFFYFNAFEGRIIDWDDTIDSPFGGIGPGGGVFWSFNGRHMRWGLNTGLTAWMEWQAGAQGVKGPRPIPHVSFELIF
jgi:hypothetical protein